MSESRVNDSCLCVRANLVGQQQLSHLEVFLPPQSLKTKRARGIIDNDNIVSSHHQHGGVADVCFVS